MKTSSIRIRIDDGEKAKIKAFADRTNKSVSDLLREAVASAISGDVPGAKQRMTCTAIRRSANHLLAVLEDKPIQFGTLRSAVVDIRAAAHELVQYR
jgi:predicted transcriptional regulator